jgi:hypothetical protein
MLRVFSNEILLMENLYFTPKAFHLVQKNYQEIDVDAYFSQTNWTLLFEQLTQMAPNRHIQPGYKNYKMLEHDLKFLTFILSEQFIQHFPEFKLDENQKRSIIEILREGIDQCSPGFHIRVNTAIQSFISPQSTDEFLQIIRNQIVENCACHGNQDIHENQRYFYLAQTEAYGVVCKLEQDPYSDPSNDKQKKIELKKAFLEHYQLFNVLRQIKQLLINDLPDYSGKRTAENSYTMGMYNKALLLVAGLIPQQQDIQQFLITDENSLVLDISWKKIYIELVNLFLQHNYLQYTSANQTMTEFLDELLFILFVPEQISEDRFQTFIENILVSTTEKIAFLEIIDHLPVKHQLRVLQSISRADFKLHFFPIMDILKRHEDLRCAFKTNFEKNHLKFVQQINIDLYLLATMGQFSRANLTELTYKMSLITMSSLQSFYNKINLYQFFNTFKHQPLLLKQQLNLFFSKPLAEQLSYLNRMLMTANNMFSLLVYVPNLQSDVIKLFELMQHINAKSFKTSGWITRDNVVHIFDNRSEFKPNVLNYLDQTKTIDEKIDYLQYAKTKSCLKRYIELLVQLHQLHQQHAYNLVEQLLLNTNRLTLQLHNQMLSIYHHKNTLKDLEKQINTCQQQLEVNEEFFQLLMPSKSNHDHQQSLIEEKRLQVDALISQQFEQTLQFRQQEQAVLKSTIQQFNTYISEILPHFAKYSWENIFKNFLMALISIPLLGLPLVFLYYQTGGKKLFFQSLKSMVHQKIIELSDVLPNYLSTAMRLGN